MSADAFYNLSASDAILMNLVVPDGPDDEEAHRANKEFLDRCAGGTFTPAEEE